MEPKSTIWEPHRSLLQWQGETFSICYLAVNSDCTCRWRSTNGQRETLLWRSRSKDTPARWNPEVSPKLFSNKPAVHLVTILSPCNIFRCLICTGTQESRPCWPPPRSTATSTCGISGGPASHQIVKQEDINRDPQKPAQSFQTIVGASHIRWSRGDCTYLARYSILDKV